MATDSMMPFVTTDVLQARHADLSAALRGGSQLAGASTRAAMGAAQELGGATLAFWQCRIKSGLESANRLAECRTPEALFDIQMDHTRATVQAYADHMARVGAIVSRATLGGLPSTSRVLVPVPGHAQVAA